MWLNAKKLINVCGWRDMRVLAYEMWGEVASFYYYWKIQLINVNASKPNWVMNHVITELKTTGFRYLSGLPSSKRVLSLSICSMSGLTMAKAKTQNFGF
jgi:hypothetical protein